jgi:hypothetical protein
MTRKEIELIALLEKLKRREIYQEISADIRTFNPEVHNRSFCQ